MKRIRLALLITLAAGLITLPQGPLSRAARTASAADSIPLAFSDNAGFVGVVNQSGLAPDILRFWTFDNTEEPIGSMPVSGLQPGEKITGAAFDNEAGSLIGVTNIGNVVRINLQTGQASPIGHISSDLTQGTIAVDYDPETEDLIISSDEGTFVNVNFSRNTPVIIDSLPSYAEGDTNGGKTPVLAAITNNKAPGANQGRTFVIDSRQDVLSMLDPASGKLKTIASLGVNASSRVGFDAVPGTIFGFASIQLEGEATSRLYQLNLITGMTTEIDILGGGNPVGELIMPLRKQEDEITCEVLPPDAENFLGETHTIKIIVKKNGEPLVGVKVLVGIGDGPNAGLGVVIETEDNPDTEEIEGEAEFSYTSDKPGLDSISIAVLAGDKMLDKGATKLWKVPNLTISGVQIDGKKLTVTGCCFQEGDKVFVNDIEQKTKSKPNNTAILIAKKGAKALKACNNTFSNRVFVRRQVTGQPVQDTQAFATCP